MKNIDALSCQIVDACQRIAGRNAPAKHLRDRVFCHDWAATRVRTEADPAGARAEPSKAVGEEATDMPSAMPAH